MELRELKIGYVPYRPDLSQPADRRRFPFFAKKNNIPFEIADVNKTYDVVLLTAPANLTQWLAYKKKHPKTKFIFEMVDSLILPSDTFTTLFQGIGRFVMGKEKQIALHYRKVLMEWIKMADVVICSSTEMKKIIERWNENVFVSLDYMETEVKSIKEDYTINGKMKLVWEGQGVVLKHLLNYKNVFNEVNDFCELHVITDPEYPTYGNLIKREVDQILKELPIQTFFHPWEIYKNYESLIQYDIGIIPLNKKNKMAWHKPANKLISFWFAGHPTLVSDTPAYIELMNAAETDMYCSNGEEWVLKIKETRNFSAEKRKAIAEKNREFVIKYYSNEAITVTWKKIFDEL